MVTTNIINVLASVAVHDFAKSVAYYQKLFGRPADSTPMPEVAEWKFERGGWLQVYKLKERAGAGSFTLAANNLEEQIAALHQIEIDPGKPMVSETAKVIMIKDPDGNSIAFSEAFDRSVAR